MSHTDMRPLKGIRGFGSAPTNSSLESRETGQQTDKHCPEHNTDAGVGSHAESFPHPMPRRAFSALFLTVYPGTPHHISFDSLGGQ